MLSLSYTKSQIGFSVYLIIPFITYIHLLAYATKLLVGFDFCV